MTDPSHGGARGPAPAKCLDKALDLLARRSHFRAELERKLLQRGFARDEVGAALDRVGELGYLDDLECGRRFARELLSRRPSGPAMVRAKLRARGAAGDTIDKVVRESFEGGESALVRQAADAWLARRAWNRERLARHLHGRGFSHGAILAALAELGEASSSRPRNPSGSEVGL